MPYGPNGGYYEWWGGRGFGGTKYKTPWQTSMINMLNDAARLKLGLPGLYAMSGDKIILAPQYQNMVGNAVKFNIQSMVWKVVNEGNQGLMDNLTILGEALILEGQDGKHLEQANKQLAAEMRKALVQRYGTAVERRKQVPSYPRQNRLSGNLRRAISQPDMAVGTAEGISYINQDRLNAEARHWARINFGVRGAPGARSGAAQSKAPEQFNLLETGKGGRSAGKIGFKPNVRPPMYLPPGFWMFIGGTASAARQRLGKTKQDYSDLDGEASRGDRLAARAAARRARADAAIGRGDDAPKVTSGGAFETIARIQNSGRGSFYTKNLNKQSGTSSWGADTGGYPRTTNYANRYRMGPGGSFGRKKKIVTRTVRGTRSSRQGFYPTGGGNERYPTRGVVATNFMDAGFRALAENVDRIYYTMAQNIIDEAENKAEQKAIRKKLVKYKVNLGRLAGLSDFYSRGGDE